MRAGCWIAFKTGGIFRCPLGITEGTSEELTLQRADQDTTTHDLPLTSCRWSWRVRLVHRWTKWIHPSHESGWRHWSGISFDGVNVGVKPKTQKGENAYKSMTYKGWNHWRSGRPPQCLWNKWHYSLTHHPGHLKEALFLVAGSLKS